MKSALKLYGLLAIIGGIALVLSLFFSTSPCIIYHLVGLPCPACGLTRAFISLARLDIAQAFAYNPLFLLVPFAPLLGHELLADTWRNRISTILVVVLLVVWIVRMVLLFPHTPPMTFNESSLVGWMLRR